VTRTPDQIREANRLRQERHRKANPGKRRRPPSPPPTAPIASSVTSGSLPTREDVLAAERAGAPRVDGQRPIPPSEVPTYADLIQVAWNEARYSDNAGARMQAISRLKELVTPPPPVVDEHEPTPDDARKACVRWFKDSVAYDPSAPLEGTP
jgi:hypothetical protein